MVSEDRVKIQGLNLLREFEGKPIYSDCAVNPVQSLAKLASPAPRLSGILRICLTVSGRVRGVAWGDVSSCTLYHSVLLWRIVSRKLTPVRYFRLRKVRYKITAFFTID